jgi:hypothetical protein
MIQVSGLMTIREHDDQIAELKGRLDAPYEACADKEIELERLRGLCARAADALEEGLCGQWKVTDEATSERSELIAQLRKAAAQ